MRHPSFAAAERLEPRRLMAAVYPSNLEQYVVELINRGRANPSAEAARYGVALNEGLAAGTISTTPKQPLAINPLLDDAARGHSQWMLATDTFGHTGAGGSDPSARMRAAGYSFNAPWTWGENIAWRSTSGSAATASLIDALHKALFVDAGIAGRGHRTNLMNESFREIGSGYLTGSFKGYSSAGMLSTDFASSAGNAFLTGVAYKDNVSADKFYTPGEGLGGVTINATRLSDNSVFSTTTFASGGYSLALPAGTYRVTASGAALGPNITFSSVSIGSQNVKEDFVPGLSTAPPPAGDTTAPTAVLTKALRKREGSMYYPFVITYSDNVAIDTATLDNFDILVRGPGGYARYAVLNSTNLSNGTPRATDYSVKGPGGRWDAGDNGLYTIWLQSKQVRDTAGNPASAKQLGAFTVIIPKAVAPAFVRAPAIATLAKVKKAADETDLLG